MAVAIRLMRLGKKGHPYYRIIAVDQRKKRNGAYLDVVGSYNPMVNPPQVEMDEKKIQSWVTKGAVFSEGMTKLMKTQKPAKKGSL